MERNPATFLCGCLLLLGISTGAAQRGVDVIRSGGIVRVGLIGSRLFFRFVLLRTAVTRLIFLFSWSLRLIRFFIVIPRPIFAGQSLRAGTGCSIRCNAFPYPRTGNRLFRSGAFCTGSGNNLKQPGKNFARRTPGSGGNCLILMLFAKLDVVFNVMPAADQDKTDDFPALLCGSGGHGCVQLRYQPEDCLDTLVAQRRLAIFDLAVQGIGEHDLQNGMEDVTGAGIFHFHHLRYSAHVLILVIAHDRQVIAEYTGKIGENPAFDVSILQHIGNVECNLHRKLQIPRIQFHIFPEIAFVGGIPGGFQIWGRRIPLEFRQIIHVSLLYQKIGIQHMT